MEVRVLPLARKVLLSSGEPPESQVFQNGSVSMGFPVAFEEEKEKSDF